MKLKSKKNKLNLYSALIVIGVVMFGFIILENLKDVKNQQISDISSTYNFNVQELESENGNRFLLYRKTNTPIIALSIRIEGGSGLDPRGYSGLGYVTTKMMLNSTKDKTNDDIIDILDKHSISLSFDIQRDYLEINLSTLSINKDIALSLLVDILENNNFDASYLEKIKNEQKASLSLSMQSQDYIASRTMVRNTFNQKQNWRPILGTINEVEKITPQVIARYKNRYFDKNKAHIAISGNIGSKASSQYVDDIMQAIKPYKGNINIEKEVNAVKGSKTFNIVNNKKNKQVVVKFVFNAPSFANKKDLSTAIVLNNLLGGGGLDSLLMTEIREKNGLTYGIYSNIVDTKYGNLWQISASTTKEKQEDLIKKVQEIISNFENNYNQNLVMEVKQWAIGSRAMRFMSNESIIRFISNDYFYNYNQIDISNYQEDIQNVKKQDIIKMANQYLDVKNMYIITVQ